MTVRHHRRNFERIATRHANHCNDNLCCAYGFSTLHPDFVAQNSEQDLQQQEINRRIITRCTPRNNRRDSNRCTPGAPPHPSPNANTRRSTQCLNLILLPAPHHGRACTLPALARFLHPLHPRCRGHCRHRPWHLPRAPGLYPPLPSQA